MDRSFSLFVMANAQQNHNLSFSTTCTSECLQGSSSASLHAKDNTKTMLGILWLLNEQGKDLIYKTWTIDGVISSRLKKDNSKVISFSTITECSKFLMNSIIHIKMFLSVE